MLYNLGNRAFLQPKFVGILTNFCHMTSTEVSTALRPFYFSVHPDLFGKYPTQRSTNENSLKQLSSVIETLQSKRKITPCSLQFYIREKKVRNTFRLVKVYLKDDDVRDAILTILKSCDLSTEYVDKLPKPAKGFQESQSYSSYSKTQNDNVDITYNERFHKGSDDFEESIKKTKGLIRLETWLEDNYQSAMQLSKSCEPAREEIDRLLKTITKELGILEIRWECGWNDQHFRGCLQSLQDMTNQNPEPMHLLNGKVLIFAPFTGVNLEGHIMLNSGEVRHNWLDFIKKIKSYDQALLRVPAFEKSVSQVLRNIQVVRRKFMPKILVTEYEENLRQFTTNISDFLTRKSYPQSWPNSLADYEIVIETEAGPLMVSPTGQFIAPSSCPGFLLVNFITENMQVAAEKISKYKENKYIERSLHAQTVQELQLIGLHKDDSVTPDLMILCCNRLLEHKHDLQNLNGILLNVTNYYSVLADGTVCIPWNWNL